MHFIKGLVLKNMNVEEKLILNGRKRKVFDLESSSRKVTLIDKNTVKLKMFIGNLKEYWFHVR